MIHIVYYVILIFLGTSFAHQSLLVLPLFQTSRTRDVAKKKSTTPPSNPDTSPLHPRRSGTRSSAATRRTSLPRLTPMMVVTSVRWRIQLTIGARVAGAPVASVTTNHSYVYREKDG